MKFDFVCCLVIWHNVLNRINIVSKYFQSPHICLITAADMLSSTKSYLVDLRTEKRFEELIEKAKEIAIKLDILASFPPPSTLRSRRKATKFSYECVDEVVSDPTLKFRIDFYFKILDQAISSVSERFEQLNEHNSIFEFLHDISGLSSKSSEFIREKCDNLEKALKKDSKSDINGLELYEELTMFSTFNVNMSSIDTLNFIFKKKLESLFPNLVIALKVLLTIPVTVASGERSFSKLKIIKNYLRSTMGQEKLVGLSVLSIESDLLENLDYNDLVNDFAKLKARRINF